MKVKLPNPSSTNQYTATQLNQADGANLAQAAKLYKQAAQISPTATGKEGLARQVLLDRAGVLADNAEERATDPATSQHAAAQPKLNTDQGSLDDALAAESAMGISTAKTPIAKEKAQAASAYLTAAADAARAKGTSAGPGTAVTAAIKLVHIEQQETRTPAVKNTLDACMKVYEAELGVASLHVAGASKSEIHAALSKVDTAKANLFTAREATSSSAASKLLQETLASKYGLLAKEGNLKGTLLTKAQGDVRQDDVAIAEEQNRLST